MKRVYHIKETLLVHCSEMPEGLIGWFCRTWDVPWQVNDCCLFPILKFYKTWNNKCVIEHGSATWGNTTTMYAGIKEINDAQGLELVNQLFKDNEIF